MHACAHVLPDDAQARSYKAHEEVVECRRSSATIKLDHAALALKLLEHRHLHLDESSAASDRLALDRDVSRAIRGLNAYMHIHDRVSMRKTE